jgi:hypothetical protein
MSVILTIQEAEIRRTSVQSQPHTSGSRDPISEIPIIKGLVDWLKVKALSSRPGMTKKKKVFGVFVYLGMANLANILLLHPPQTPPLLPTKVKNRRGRGSVHVPSSFFRLTK